MEQLNDPWLSEDVQPLFFLPCPPAQCLPRTRADIEQEGMGDEVGKAGGRIYRFEHLSLPHGSGPWRTHASALTEAETIL